MCGEIKAESDLQSRCLIRGKSKPSAPHGVVDPSGEVDPIDDPAPGRRGASTSGACRLGGLREVVPWSSPSLGRIEERAHGAPSSRCWPREHSPEEDRQESLEEPLRRRRWTSRARSGCEPETRARNSRRALVNRTDHPHEKSDEPTKAAESNPHPTPEQWTIMDASKSLVMEFSMHRLTMKSRA